MSIALKKIPAPLPPVGGSCDISEERHFACKARFWETPEIYKEAFCTVCWCSYRHEVSILDWAACQLSDVAYVSVARNESKSSKHLVQDLDYAGPPILAFFYSRQSMV